MISINKSEAKALRENLPGVHIVRTMKQKSKRGHYFCEETKQAMYLLKKLRKGLSLCEKVGERP
jgi:hypothetical protein